MTDATHSDLTHDATVDPAVGRLARLVAVPTVSRADPAETDWSAFARFRELLAETFPHVHAELERELIAEHTLVMRWRGQGDGAPVVLMAHQDVVDPGTKAWTHPPFGAELHGTGDDLALWGRGTIDDKGSLSGILEAVEQQLAAGFRPSRDVYLVFGHDEETHGTGAAAAAALLQQRGIRPEFVLDEGGAIVAGFLPGVAAPLAAIGLAEKGTVLLELSVEDTGGHGSTPPPISAIGRLARAITRMDAKPFPSVLTSTVRAMFQAAGRGATGAFGVLYRGASWSGPILRRALVASGPEGDAMTRTTRVATTIRGGHAQNAIPEQASAVVNLRVLPGSSVAEAAEHVRRAIDDPLVRVEVISGSEPSPVSPASGPGWDLIAAVLAEVVPDAIPTPYTQTGATDGRHFTAISERVYRFTPFDLTAAERGGLHAVDERIRVSSYLRGVRFYRELVGRL